MHHMNGMQHKTAPVPEWAPRLHEAMAGCSTTGEKIVDLLLMQCVRQTGSRQLTLSCSVPSEKYRSFSLAVATFAGNISAERSWPSLIYVPYCFGCQWVFFLNGVPSGGDSQSRQGKGCTSPATVLEQSRFRLIANWSIYRFA